MGDPSEEPQKHFLSNKLYDVLKLLALVVFPALGTLYFTVAGIWGLSGAQEVVSTIVALDTFLGVIIKLGDVSYNATEGRFAGDIVIKDAGGGKKVFSLELKDEPETLVGKKEVVFKVKKRRRT